MARWPETQGLAQAVKSMGYGSLGLCGQEHTLSAEKYPGVEEQGPDGSAWSHLSAGESLMSFVWTAPRTEVHLLIFNVLGRLLPNRTAAYPETDSLESLWRTQS